MIARSRVASAILAILLVTVAAVALRLSAVDTDSDLVRVPLDRATAYQSGQVRVSDVRVGTEIRLGDDRHTTQGLYVVVDVAERATGRDTVVVGSSRLLTQDGVTYLPAFADAPFSADPGFETVHDLVFEVDPARIDGLTLELWNQSIVYRYYQRTQTPLGITAGNAGAWVAAGKGRSLVVPQSDVSTALT